MALFGISTSALQDKHRFDLLLGFEPAVVEFYNYPSRELPRIEAFCSRHGIRPALHTPTPYDDPEPLRRFAPTGPDPAEVRRAIALTLASIRAARRMKALHLVVHFPSPYADAPPDLGPEAIDAFMAPVSREAREAGVRLLIENMSSHPTFHRPEHYEALLDRYDGVGFCLDLGHAAQLGGMGSIGEFAARLGTRIRSAHVYNWRPGGSGHAAVGPEQHASDGWIDLAGAVARLREDCAVDSWVLEPDPLSLAHVEAARSGARWLRGVIDA